MSKRTFASRTFAALTFASATWAGEMTAPLLDGQLSCEVSCEPALSFSVRVNEVDETMIVLHPGSDNDVLVTSLTLESTDAYVNTATVAATLKDTDGNTVSGGTCSCTYVTASNGNYRGTLTSAVSITAGLRYNLHVTAAADSANVLAVKECVAAHYQGEV